MPELVTPEVAHPECALCGRHGQTLLVFRDRGRDVCESCLMATCGYRLAGEAEPCGMAIELGGGTWRHVYRAADRYHAAVAQHGSAGGSDGGS